MLLIGLKIFGYTTVDWVFILIFIYYGLFSLPDINFKNLLINIDTIDTAKLKEIYTNIPPINDNISSSGINAMRAFVGD
jgi:hypothetical protein